MKHGLGNDRSGSPVIIVRNRGVLGKTSWLELQKPVGILVADELSEVRGTINAIEEAVGRGLFAAGFLSYEAAPALDSNLRTHPQGPLPLSWWGLFERAREIEPPLPVADNVRLAWRPRIARADYYRAVEKIRDLISAGDTYQVNFTFNLTTRFGHRPFDLFAAMVQAQPDSYAAYLDTGRFVVCSASPELFLQLDGNELVVRPMKGTAGRGRFSAEDADNTRRLRANAKDRAENLMVVDMMRNDLGRIAIPGTVRVEELFAVETHPTVHQLTSTISARTDASLLQIFQALFPCSSITGAPKVRTCEIIRDLESEARGVYTGAIGFFGPHRKAQLSVGIRTATIDRELHFATYGIGSGIVWDSDAAVEFDECRTKALLLTLDRPDFALLETLLWRPASGFALRERHLQRLMDSAEYFGFPSDRTELEARVADIETRLGDEPLRVRLQLDRDGQVTFEYEPWTQHETHRWRLALAEREIDSHDLFLFHKTTHREVYRHARETHPDADEVLLWNERGELTEATTANLVVKLGGEWLTPPVSCGLLAGTFRAELLATSRAREKILPINSLLDAQSIFLVNSLRGWIRCRIDRQNIAETLHRSGGG